MIGKARISRHVSETANGLLGTAFVIRDRHAREGSEITVEIADDLAHGDLIRIAGEEIPRRRRNRDDRRGNRHPTRAGLGRGGLLAGVVVGARWPHSTHIPALLLEKPGFDLSEIVLGFWDPEGRERAAIERQLPAPRARAKRAPKSKPQTVREPRRIEPRAVVMVRRFSSRPALSAA
jgi:hypothetical protein